MRSGKQGLMKAPPERFRKLMCVRVRLAPTNCLSVSKENQTSL